VTLAPFGRRLAPVVENRKVGAYCLLIAADPDGPADPRPGQFYMLAAEQGWGAGEGERPYLPRAFSFARAREGQLWFLLEDIGPGTHRLAQLEPGENLWLTGPLGIGFEPPTGRPILVGGGIGTAPLLCLQDQIGPEAPVLLGFRSAPHAEAASLFTGDPQVTTDDGSIGRQALVTELLREELDRRTADGGRPTIFSCGPPQMLEAVRAMCAEHDIPAQLALESGMACGFGACFGCVVPTKKGYIRLCVDGPVLPADQLDTALAPH